MNYLSVCSGMEAATVAWHPLGWRAVGYSEIELFPSAVLAHHYPDVPNHGDFTTLLRNPPAGVDVLVGGTPCQAFSVAGLRGGLSDPRGNLALAFVALVGVLRPRWVVWENVPGVLSSGGGRDFGSFLGALGELGYGWAYRVLDAQYFGLAQRRQRVFVVASPGDWRRSAAVLFEPEGVRRDSPPRRRSGAGVAGAVTRRAGSGGPDDNSAQAGQVVPCGLDDGALARSLNAHPARMDLDTETLIAHTLRAEGHDASEDGTGRGVPLVACSMQEDGQNGVTLRDIAGTVRSDAPGSQQGGSLAFVEPQAFNWQSGGDCRGLELRDTSGTLSKMQTPATFARSGVRRLMPHELERLQGFPTVERRVTITVCETRLERPQRQYATPVASHSVTAHADPAQRARVHVLIDYERRVLLLRNHERSWSYALNVEDHDSSRPSTPPAGIVPALARMMLDAANEARNGAEVSPPSTSGSTSRPCGTICVAVSGQDIADYVRDAAPGPTPPTVAGPSTTSQVGVGTQPPASILKTSCCSVVHAIGGFIPEATWGETSFEIEVVESCGYTRIPYRGKPASECPDGPRAKALGNSMAVPVMRWIGERIALVDRLP